MPGYSTYEQVGIKEDVHDVIYYISPYDTPLITMAKKGKASNTLHEWQEDSLRAPQKNAQVEGADTTFSALTPTVMRQNYTQIFEESAQITDTSESVMKYGRAKEMAYQVAKKGKELKKDIEAAFVGAPGGSRQTAVAGGTGIARELAGAHAQVATATTNENGGTARAFDEAQVLDVLEKCYNEGGEPSVLLVPTGKAKDIAGFALSAGRERDFGSNKTLTHAIDLYVSPYGEVKVMIDRWQDPSSVLAIDPEYWKVCHLRNFRSIPLAKTGSNEKRLIDCELTLACLNAEASGLIDDLNP